MIIIVYGLEMSLKMNRLLTGKGVACKYSTMISSGFRREALSESPVTKVWTAGIELDKVQ
jgi:hypothetical protein